MGGMGEIMGGMAQAVLLNKAGSGAADIAFRFDELTWQGTAALSSSKHCHVKSVWGGQEVGIFSGGFSVPVNGSSAFFAIVSGCDVGK